jgi:hypothetical protein
MFDRFPHRNVTVSCATFTIATIAGTIVCGVLITLAPVPAQSAFESAKFGVLYQKWDMPSAPAGKFDRVGAAHETLAARDCVNQKNFALACEHYRRAIAAFDKLDPAISARNGVDVKAPLDLDQMALLISYEMEQVGCR